MLNTTVYEMISQIANIRVNTKLGVFFICHKTTDEIWNILNRVSLIEDIPLLDQIDTFELWLKDNGHV